MLYKVIFYNEKIITRDLSKVPKKNLDLIFLKLDWLEKSWIWTAQIKKLNNYELADYRLRVWDFRILFNLDSINKEIIVFRILHRSELY